MKEGEEATEKLMKAEERSMKPKTEDQRKEQCALQYKTYKQQALSQLILRMWTQAQANELGISVSEGEVASQVKTREASQKSAARNSRASGSGLPEPPRYTGSDLKEVVIYELLRTQVEAKVREKFAHLDPPGQDELEEFFNEHKQLYAEPETRTTDVASIKSKRVADTIAKDHSNVLTKTATEHGATAIAESVSCTQANPSSSPSPLLAPICAARRGVISKPIKVAGSYYIFEVTKITPAIKPTFDRVQSRIDQTLRFQNEQQELLKYNEKFEKEMKDKTECAAGHLVEFCKEYTAP